MIKFSAILPSPYKITKQRNMASNKKNLMC